MYHSYIYIIHQVIEARQDSVPALYYFVLIENIKFLKQEAYQGVRAERCKCI